MNTKLYKSYANNRMAFFKSHVYINNNKRGKVTNIDMPNWKEHILSSNNILIRKIRDVGMTELIAADIAYQLNFNSNITILYMTINSQMAYLARTKMMRHYKNIPDSIRIRIKNDLKYEMMLDNGSKVLFSSPSPTVGRSHSFNAIYMDEVDSIRDFENIYLSLMPTLSYTNGKILITSTPIVKNMFFDNLWISSNNYDKLELTYKTISGTSSYTPKKKSLNDISRTAYSKIIRKIVIT